MNKPLSILFIVTIAVTVTMSYVFAGTGNIVRDADKIPIQSFVPDPAKSQVNSSMTGTIRFAKDGTGKVNIKNWMVISINPTSEGKYYYNEDSNKTFPLPAGVSSGIFVSHPNVISVTVQFGGGTASVQGM